MNIASKVALLLVVSISVASCNEAPKSEAELATKEFNHYVDSMRTMKMEYTDAHWSSMENGYKIRMQKAEAQLAKMDAKQKADYEASKVKYTEMATQYQMELSKKYPVIDSKKILRNSLFGEGKVGDDMSFEFANASNLLSTYQTFYDAMYANKDNYSREDWDEVKVLYEALDTRKNEVEDKLAGADNRKIATLKIKISGVYDLYRPGSKVQENSDAKK
jgi:hypothetical protein